MEVHWVGFLRSSIVEWIESTDAYMSMTNIIGRKIKRGVVFILLNDCWCGCLWRPGSWWIYS